MRETVTSNPSDHLRMAGVVDGSGFVVPIPIDIAGLGNEHFLAGLVLAGQHAGAVLGLEHFG
jgi:hypothetical protein